MGFLHAGIAAEQLTGAADEFLAAVACHGFQGLVYRDEDTLGIDDHDAVADGVDHRLPIIVQFLIEHVKLP